MPDWDEAEMQDLLSELLRESAVTFEDDRLSWIEVQVTKSTWRRIEKWGKD